MIEMKMWQETQAVMGEVQRLHGLRQNAVIALLYRIKGSSFRRPGAKLLIREDGSFLGNVSGGCLEEDLRERAMQVLASREPVSVHYDTGSDEDTAWGLGLGCGGEVDLWLQPVYADQPLGVVAELLDRLDGEKAFAVQWGLSAESMMPIAILPPDVLEEGERTRVSEVAGRAFLEAFTPPPNLLLCGAGMDSDLLGTLGMACGFRVTVIDHRPAYLGSSPVPNRVRRRPEDGLDEVKVTDRTAVVVKSHALNIDRGWAEFFAGTDAGYVGILGPKHRREDVLKQVPDAARSRFYGPAGLDVGGEGAEQMALSILAEIFAVLNGRTPGHLRDREGSIHAS
ncbi:MAG TPA: XdhC family protein [Kiritimatiellia bacterium]|nr:XdhC family protein [Kiritimatiellia bacterium]